MRKEDKEDKEEPKLILASGVLDWSEHLAIMIDGYDACPLKPRIKSMWVSVRLIKRGK